MISNQGGAKKRFYLIGSDYIYPWTAHYIIEKYLKQLDPGDVEIVGFQYPATGHRDFSAIVREIKKLEPDVIFNTINGESNRYFFGELALQGITSDTTPVMSMSVGEDELRGMQPSQVQGHLAAWSYFQSIDTPRNRRFVRRFKNEHGRDRLLSDPMESAYSQVYLWKLAVEKAQSFQVDRVRDAFASNIEFSSPGGLLKLDPKTFHVYKRGLIGCIREDRQFDIVYESPDWIQPNPYPPIAFPGWDCDWTRGGVTQGKPVQVTRPNQVG